MTFKVPWEAITDYRPGYGEEMAHEAKVEIGPAHPLAGRRLVTLARRGDRNEILFELDGGPKVAVVRLTRSGFRERTGIPHTQTFRSLDDFLKTKMEADRIEFANDGASDEPE